MTSIIEDKKSGQAKEVMEFEEWLDLTLTPLGPSGERMLRPDPEPEIEGTPVRFPDGRLCRYQGSISGGRGLV